MEKNAIYIASLLSYTILYGSEVSDTYTMIFVFLSALICTELAIYADNKRIRLGLLVVYLLASLIYWQFIFFLPVVFFFVMEEQFKYGVGVVLLYGLLYVRCDYPVAVGADIIVCIFSGIIAYESSRVDKYRKKYQYNRDSSTELEQMLKQKNRELLESQDANVSIATLKERNRIAREIHDNVGHMLSRTILQTGALMAVYKDEPLHGQIQSINESLNDAMNNIRESVHDLHDESVDLKLSVTEVLKPLKKNYDIDFDYDMSGGTSRNVKYCFISIVKEATSNIVKHSSASNIYILMREHPGFYQLAVEDNGHERIDVKHAGIGLNNMRDRVEGLGGNITISDEKGFKILVSIPKGEENKNGNENSCS